MATKLLKSLGLILGTLGAWVIAGVFACIVIWMILIGLFSISRFSKRAKVFAEWSWIHFSLTIASALGIPYVFLLLSPGF